jgi:hypothetical protein
MTVAVATSSAALLLKPPPAGRSAVITASNPGISQPSRW